MAKCFVTGKTTSFKTQVSHSHRKSNKKVKANLHKIHIEENGTRKRIVVSARALKKLKLKRV